MRTSRKASKSSVRDLDLLLKCFGPFHCWYLLHLTQLHLTFASFRIWDKSLGNPLQISDFSSTGHPKESRWIRSLTDLEITRANKKRVVLLFFVVQLYSVQGVPISVDYITDQYLLQSSQSVSHFHGYLWEYLCKINKAMCATFIGIGNVKFCHTFMRMLNFCGYICLTFVGM